tara:strand:- start:635 stop:994 length:360 start_codon:yes stop_codon:yes gene_type:complete
MKYELSDIKNTEDDIILVSLNRKPSDLSELNGLGGWITKCLPIKILDLNQEQFDEFTSDFYKQYDFLENNNFGNVCTFHNQDCLMVLQVRNEDTCESIYIDNQGYNYCRYVGYQMRRNK